MQMPAKGLRASASTCCSSFCGTHTSSWSRKDTSSPCARSRPRLRAAATQVCSWRRYVTGYPRAMSALRSAEPSSTTIASTGDHVCARTLSIASARKRSPLNTGITTLTSGPSAIGRLLPRPLPPGRSVERPHPLSGVSCGRRVVVVNAFALQAILELDDLRTRVARAQDPVGVVGGAVGIVEAAHLAEHGAPHEQRAELVVPPARLGLDVGGVRDPVGHVTARFQEGLEPARADVGGGVVLERVYLQLELAGEPDVV